MASGPLSGRLVANRGARLSLLGAGAAFTLCAVMLTGLTATTSVGWLLARLRRLRPRLRHGECPRSTTPRCSRHAARAIGGGGRDRLDRPPGGHDPGRRGGGRAACLQPPRLNPSGPRPGQPSSLVGHGRRGRGRHRARARSPPPPGHTVRPSRWAKRWLRAVPPDLPASPSARSSGSLGMAEAGWRWRVPIVECQARGTRRRGRPTAAMVAVGTPALVDELMLGLWLLYRAGQIVMR